MNEQERIAGFVKQYRLESRPEWRALDLSANAGALAKELLSTSDYGKKPVAGGNVALEERIGYCLYSLLALANDLGVNADRGLETATAKKAEYHKKA